MEDGDEMWECLSQMPAMDLFIPPQEDSHASRKNLIDKTGLENIHRKSPRSAGQGGKVQKSYRM